MKFVMNGSCIIGTMDGANVEICEEAGEENEFIFGARIEEINGLREHMKNTDPNTYLPPQLKEVLDVICSG